MPRSKNTEETIQASDESWAIKQYLARCPKDVQTAQVYAAPEGGVKFFWRVKHWDIEVTVRHGGRIGWYQAINKIGEDAREEAFDLAAVGWDEIAQLIRDIKAGACQ